MNKRYLKYYWAFNHRPIIYRDPAQNDNISQFFLSPFFVFSWKALEHQFRKIFKINYRRISPIFEIGEKIHIRRITKLKLQNLHLKI